MPRQDSVEDRQSPTALQFELREGDAGLVQLLRIVWKRKYWILAGTATATVMGIIYSLLAAPVYYSQAIITLKETGKGGDAARLFSQLGGMGGMVASQLGLGNTNLDKLEVILKGHELAGAIIEKYNLLPALYPKLWDAEKGSWKPTNGAKSPNQRKAIKILTGSMLLVSLDARKGMIKVGINARDSLLSKQFVEFYLNELNNKIRSDVIKEAEANREYLERQLINTLDPVLREKIHSMIGFEIEKSMLVSSQAFEVLEKPVVPMERAKPKRKLIVILSFFIGFVASMAVIFAQLGMQSLGKAADKAARQ